MFHKWHANRFYIYYTGIISLLAFIGYYSEVYKPHAVQQMHVNRYFATDLTYVDLPRISMNLKSSVKSSRVNIDISLEVARKDAWRLNDFQSRITDRIVSYMYKQDVNDLRPPKDIAWLHKDLLHVINSTNQPVTVHDVIFRELVIM